MKKNLEEHIEEIKQEEPNYEGTLIRTEYDLSKISNPEFNKELDAYAITFGVHHTFHEPNGTLGWLLTDRDKDEYTRSRKLTVIYDEEAEEWKLDSNENETFMISDSDAEAFVLSE